MVILLNWDYIRNVIIKDDDEAQLMSKMNMFDTSPTKSGGGPDRTSFSEDGILNRATRRAPLQRPPVGHTLWYKMMIVIDFLISQKKSIIIISVAIGLYWFMF